MSSITRFSRQLKIQDGNGNVVGGSPYISFFSLEKKQKAAALTLMATALIIFSMGATSLGGSHIVGTNAAWAMFGLGLGITTVTAGSMIINHLLFIREVGKFLATQHQNTDWQNEDYYPDDTSSVSPQFSYSHGTKTIYGKSYLKLPCGMMMHHIDFHRTRVIHNERA